MNWEKDISSILYGYRTRNSITPCFVTYHKSNELEGDINYNDYFVTPAIFAWESKSKRTLNSPDVKKVISSKRILLFIKKEDGEGTDFYYLGDVSILPGSIKQETTDKGSSVVHFKFQLDKPVIDDLYNYIITS